jgi:RecJ-like exonuclease
VSVTCPYCNGKKVVRMTFIKAKETKRQNRVIIDKNGTQDVPCTWCYGFGTVSENTAHLIHLLGQEQN